MGETNNIKECWTILVTGGNGIVGSHVVDTLLADKSLKANVVATHHKQRQYRNPEARYRECDFTNNEDVIALLDDVQPHVIIHTVSPGPFAPFRTQHHVNYVATEQLLQAARNHPKVRAFVYTSSVEAVEIKSGLKSRPETEEEAILNGLKSRSSAYGRTKGAADALVLSYNTGPAGQSNEHLDENYKGKLSTTCLRIGGLYGERDEKTIAKLLKLVNTIGSRFQVGPNKAVHDWVYTENVALAHVLAANALLHEGKTECDSKVNGEGFYITDGEPMLFWDFVRKVLIEAGDRGLRKVPQAKVIQVPFGVMLLFANLGEGIYNIFTLGYKAPKMRRHHFDFMKKGCWFSIEKARERLGYEPVCDTDEGICRSVKWFRHGGIDGGIKWGPGG